MPFHPMGRCQFEITALIASECELAGDDEEENENARYHLTRKR